MHRLFPSIETIKKYICKQVGHKEGWWPTAPWICERCGVDFKEIGEKTW